MQNLSDDYYCSIGRCSNCGAIIVPINDNPLPKCCSRCSHELVHLSVTKDSVRHLLNTNAETLHRLNIDVKEVKI